MFRSVPVGGLKTTARSLQELVDHDVWCTFEFQREVLHRQITIHEIRRIDTSSLQLNAMLLPSGKDILSVCMNGGYAAQYGAEAIAKRKVLNS